MARGLRNRGFDVVLTADAGLSSGVVEWDGLPVHAAPSERPASLVGWLDLLEIGPDDLVVTFLDLFRLSKEPLGGRNVVSWTPVQTDPLEAYATDHLRATGSVALAMTRFGQASMAAAGIDAEVIPVGVDRSVFCPLVPGDREASRRLAREALAIPADVFLVGVVATNTQAQHNRKSLPEICRAVGELAREAPGQVALYLHTAWYAHQQGGQDLGPLLHATVPDVPVFSTPPTVFDAGLPAEELALRYNAFDVLCAPSASEGFCVPLVEAQACGVPVIASDFSAQPENVGAGWLVDVQPRWYAPDARWWCTPSIPSILTALRAALAEGAGRFAEAVAFAAAYDHDRLLDERWVPLLRRHGCEPTADPGQPIGPTSR
jgi:glycosyltransferase involved in cell wall biosynthesis